MQWKNSYLLNLVNYHDKALAFYCDKIYNEKKFTTYRMEELL